MGNQPVELEWIIFKLRREVRKLELELNLLSDGDTLKLRHQLRSEHDADVAQISQAAQARGGKTFPQRAYEELISSSLVCWFVCAALEVNMAVVGKHFTFVLIVVLWLQSKST